MRIQNSTMIAIAMITLATAAFADAEMREEFGLDTAFVYQGRLTQKDRPADGVYDLELELWNQKEGGTFLGRTSLFDHQIANGRFEARLDFGQNVHGQRLWLEIHVRPAGGEAYTTLEPRQLLASAKEACIVGSDLIVEGYVGIGVNPPLSALHLEGNLTLPTRVETTGSFGHIPMTDSDLVLFAGGTSDDFFVTLPSASASTIGRFYLIYNTTNHQMVVEPQGTDTIIGSATIPNSHAGSYVQVIGYSATQWVATSLY